MTGPRTKNVVTGFLLIVISCLFLTPILITIMNSLKPVEELVNPFYQFPRHPTFDNFPKVLSTTRLPRAYLFSFLVVVVSTLGTLTLSSMASYAIARCPNRFNTILYFVIVAGMMIPFSVIMIPLMSVAGALKITNIAGLIVIYFALGLSTPTLILTGFIKGTLPREFEESAFIDGAGNFTIFMRVVLPLLSAPLVTSLILTGMWIFNDFLLPSLVLSQKAYTVPLALYVLSGQYKQVWNELFAGFAISFVPIFTVFVFLQKYFLKGATEGALKG